MRRRLEVSWQGRPREALSLGPTKPCDLIATVNDEAVHDCMDEGGRATQDAKAERQFMFLFVAGLAFQRSA